MSPWHAIVPAYLALCLMLGGASAAGATPNVLLQLAALPVLVIAVAASRRSPISREARPLAIILMLVGALVAVQLVPLPPAIWTQLPGRDGLVSGFELLGQPLPWLPLSLAPDDTLASALWLLPALAVLVGIVRAGAYQPLWLAAVIVGTMVASVVLGAIQVAGGAVSPSYFYRITNHGVAVGFFANANHLATLLVVSVPFIAAMVAIALKRNRSRRKASGLLALSAVALVLVAVGLFINNSLAGIGLVVPALAASGLLVWRRKSPLPGWAFGAVALLGVAAVGLVLTAPLGNNLTSAAGSDMAASRETSFSVTLAAATDFFPVGSGIGTFVEIYRTHEDPAEVIGTYMNHAHNDYFELALETGLPGLLLIGIFLIWWGARTVAIWREAEPDPFARAATVASAVIILHSFVDYPLRTAAISALFGACLALMVKPRPKSAATDEAEPAGRHLSAD